MTDDSPGPNAARMPFRPIAAFERRARRSPGPVARPLLAIGLLGASLLGGAAQADTKVAFLGDQGGDGTARAVLDLVRDEGSDLLVLQGDFAYDWGIDSWIGHMEGALGPDFPVLGVVGNHEESDWPIYRTWFEKRIERVPGLSCDGEVGVKAHCTYRGISVVQTAPGVTEVPGVSSSDDYPGFIERSFADDPNAWRVCSFHKMMRRMQVGLKADRTGWGVYEACREAGAIVATAHSHTYSRTHLLSDFESQAVADGDDDLEIAPGRTIAFVSGLGGKSVRAQARGGEWWASIHTATQGATHGALFCTFGETRASCEFKDIAGGVADRFTLRVAGGASADGDADTSEAVVERTTDASSVSEPAPAIAEPAAVEAPVEEVVADGAVEEVAVEEVAAREVAVEEMTVEEGAAEDVTSAEVAAEAVPAEEPLATDVPDEPSVDADIVALPVPMEPDAVDEDTGVQPGGEGDAPPPFAVLEPADAAGTPQTRPTVVGAAPLPGDSLVASTVTSESPTPAAVPTETGVTPTEVAPLVGEGAGDVPVVTLADADASAGGSDPAAAAAVATSGGGGAASGLLGLLGMLLRRRRPASARPGSSAGR